MNLEKYSTDLHNSWVKLKDIELCIESAHRLGIRACTLYICACVKAVVARGLHGLSCRRSTASHQRHSMLNGIVGRAIKCAEIQTHKEPTGLILLNSKRPDEATLIPWSRVKALSWDVTVPDTYAISHLQSAALEAGSTAKHAA